MVSVRFPVRSLAVGALQLLVCLSFAGGKAFVSACCCDAAKTQTVPTSRGTCIAGTTSAECAAAGAAYYCGGCSAGSGCNPSTPMTAVGGSSAPGPAAPSPSPSPSPSPDDAAPPPAEAPPTQPSAGPHGATAGGEPAALELSASSKGHDQQATSASEFLETADLKPVKTGNLRQTVISK